MESSNDSQSFLFPQNMRPSGTAETLKRQPDRRAENNHGCMGQIIRRAKLPQVSKVCFPQGSGMRLPIGSGMRLPIMICKMPALLAMPPRMASPWRWGSLTLFGLLFLGPAGLHAQLAPSPDASPVSNAPAPKPDAEADEPRTTIKVDVDLVSLYFTVKGKDGTLIPTWARTIARCRKTSRRRNLRISRRRTTSR